MWFYPISPVPSSQTTNSEAQRSPDPAEASPGWPQHVGRGYAAHLADIESAKSKEIVKKNEEDGSVQELCVQTSFDSVQYMLMSVSDSADDDAFDPELLEHAYLFSPEPYPAPDLSPDEHPWERRKGDGGPRTLNGTHGVSTKDFAYVEVEAENDTPGKLKRAPVLVGDAETPGLKRVGPLAAEKEKEKEKEKKEKGRWARVKDVLRIFGRKSKMEDKVVKKISPAPSIKYGVEGGLRNKDIRAVTEIVVEEEMGEKKEEDVSGVPDTMLEKAEAVVAEKENADEKKMEKEKGKAAKKEAKEEKKKEKKRAWAREMELCGAPY